MKLLLFLTIIICSLISCGRSHQKNTSDTPQQEVKVADNEYLRQTLLFLNDVKQKELNDRDFVLADKPFGFEYFDCLQPLLKDTAHLTASERAFIIEQSKKRLIDFWKTSFFPKISIIDNDTIQSIFQDQAKGWEYFYKHYGQSFSSFSAPIFLRDYKFCIFYSDRSCGNKCGTGQLKLYQKEDGKWKQVETYCDWIS